MMLFDYMAAISVLLMLINKTSSVGKLFFFLDMLTLMIINISIRSDYLWGFLYNICNHINEFSITNEYGFCFIELLTFNMYCCTCISLFQGEKCKTYNDSL